MNSFELEIDEKSLIGSTFMARVANEVRRAATIEKSKRKLTQQAIADKIGTSRAVVNREMSGLENLGSRRIAELLWAMGWEPYFEARKVQSNMGHSSNPVSATTEGCPPPKDESVMPKSAANMNEMMMAAE